ncbi:dihydropteroate synthase [Rhodococcus pyridinivorans]
MLGPDSLAVLGVLNVTPDSFSDGGKYSAHHAAVEQGLRLRRAGATFVDVGGESTRPGAKRVTVEIEKTRVLPIVSALVDAGVPVGIDTLRAETASSAVRVGAAYINDVSGGRADPGMYDVAAESGVPLILGHWRTLAGAAPIPAVAPDEDIVSVVLSDLTICIERALAAGVNASSIVVDPGLGFGKTLDENWALLAGHPQLTALGFPVLIGASRKSFLGTLLQDRGGVRSPEGRDIATAVISALAARAGMWGVRVHDVKATVDALRVAMAWPESTAMSVSRD